MKNSTFITWLLSLVFFYLIMHDNAIAQDNPSLIQKRASNTVFVEIVGNAPVVSLNYERFIDKYIGVRLGIGVSPFWESIPAMVNFYIGNDNKLEFGLGMTYMKGRFFHIDLEGTLLTANIGYRYQPVAGGVLFRIGFTPFYRPNTGEFIPCGGLSIGLAF